MAIVEEHWLAEWGWLTRSQKAVIAGVDWLVKEGKMVDAQFERLNVVTLNVGDPGRCALTQATGEREFWNAVAQLKDLDPNAPHGYDHDWLIQHGFWSYPYVRYETLTDWWREAIEAERGEWLDDEELVLT